MPAACIWNPVKFIRQVALVCVFCVGSVGQGPALAEEEGKSDAKEKTESKDKEAEKPVVVKREITLNDQVIPYEITTGKLPLKSDDGKKLADVFFIAYTKTDAEPKERPVTFAFNGRSWIIKCLVAPGHVGTKASAVSR